MNEKLEVKQDQRGKLIEIFKISGVGQVFIQAQSRGLFEAIIITQEKLKNSALLRERLKSG